MLVRQNYQNEKMWIFMNNLNTLLIKISSREISVTLIQEISALKFEELSQISIYFHMLANLC